MPSSLQSLAPEVVAGAAFSKVKTVTLPQVPVPLMVKTTGLFVSRQLPDPFSPSSIAHSLASGRGKEQSPRSIHFNHIWVSPILPPSRLQGIVRLHRILWSPQSLQKPFGAARAPPNYGTPSFSNFRSAQGHGAGDKTATPPRQAASCNFPRRP